jgi:glycosyltransferase involved in cell wall biosynthesis
MTKLDRVVFIGNSSPRRCGIATFTTDLYLAIGNARPELDTSIIAMTDVAGAYEYPPAVRLEVKDDDVADYIRAADILNATDTSVVSLQHEFGIFGGEAGGHILQLLAKLKMPVVTTLHTVLESPNPAQRAVTAQIINASARVVVMAEKARQLLLDVYKAPANKIDVIPHGIPDVAFVEPDDAKEALGFQNRAVILTFGLLSPNKGIEVMIDAMPAILRSRPDAVYVVLGATHPNLVREHGEVYRDSLVERARSLGVARNVVFLDQFVDLPTLIQYISMSDVYVTPYLNESQMTSGTLAYSFGLGKAVVSTPYWHATEILADGRGILVPFGDSFAIGREVASLLTDEDRRLALRKRAYSIGRSMTWDRAAERYLSIFSDVVRGKSLSVVALPERTVRLNPIIRTEPNTDYLQSMCDDTGIYQHAVHSVPDRAHGYCVDDNARALLLSCFLSQPGERPLQDELTTHFAAFVQHAWNPDRKRFRNFMSFDRRWLEEIGSEDSHGRTLWALGECSRADSNSSRRNWAASLFKEALAPVSSFRSPRAWAFTLLGLNRFCSNDRDNEFAEGLRRSLADQLMALLLAAEAPDWEWFEDGLAYDNARLPQALIDTGLATKTQSYIATGLRSLRWLAGLQRNAGGLFRPIGSQTFGDQRTAPKPFDQQPLEATATIGASFSAWRADGDARWIADAERAFAWFLGANDLQIPLVDPATGSCRDGLHPDRANENRGGESVLSYLLGHVEIRQMARAIDHRPKCEPFRALRA